MHLHRTLIATAVTVGSLVGALALTDQRQPQPSAQTAASTDADSLSSASADSPSGPTGAAPSTAVPTTATPAAAANQISSTGAIAIPDGVEPLQAELAPPDSDSPIATGREAAAWLEQAPPSVREQVADNLDTTPEELNEQFLTDPTAFLSSDGMAGYIEPTAAGEATPSTTDVALAPVPADVFALHSLPSSTKVVFLDFDGHLMQNEYWNSASGIGPFDNKPYDIDVTTQTPGSTGFAARR